MGARRAVFLVIALVACRRAPIAERGTPPDGGGDGSASDTAADSAAEVGVDAVIDLAGDVGGDDVGTRDVAGDLPDRCSAAEPLVLAGPTISAGTFAAGETVSLVITMTDTAAAGHVPYPEVILSSLTSGVVVRNPEVGPVGSVIYAGESRTITFGVRVDPTVAAGTVAEFSARAVQAGSLDCPNAFVLGFSLVVKGCPPCAATEICRWREAVRDFACVANPCVGQPLTCDCAQRACSFDWGPGMPPTCTATMKDGVDIVCTGGGMCASPDTPVATPAGPRAIATLVAGDLVWSVDHDAMQAVPLVRVQRTPAANHHVVRLQLEDGTVLEISARHPLADGRSFGSLEVGERLDGRLIVSRAMIPYRSLHTYDILPASDTGTYLAGGVLLGSTLE